MPKLTQCNVDRNSIRGNINPLDNAPLPYVRLYVSDWIVDTSTIDVEASGAYIHLCIVWWTTQRPLPSDVSDLSNMLGIDERHGEFLLSQVAHLFRDVDGGVEPIRFAKYRKEATRRMAYSRSGNVAKATKVSMQRNVDRNSSPLDVDRNSIDGGDGLNVDYITKKNGEVNIPVRGCSGMGAEPNGSRASEYINNHDLSNHDEIINREPTHRTSEARTSGTPTAAQDEGTLILTPEANATNVSRTTRKRARSNAAQSTDDAPADFVAWWAAYPRKSGRPVALRSWLRDKPDLSKCLAALEWQRRSEQWTRDGGQYIPMPSTYLNQRRYDDEPMEPQRYVSPTTVANARAVQEFLALDKPQPYTQDDDDAF